MGQRRKELWSPTGSHVAQAFLSGSGPRILAFLTSEFKGRDKSGPSILRPQVQPHVREK
jgi:homoserine kinase